MVKIIKSTEHFLLQIEPEKDDSALFLKQWIENNITLVKEKMISHGGIYFKGFNITSALEFETISQAIAPKLCDRHPFNCSNRTWHTKYTCEVASPFIKQSLVPKGMHNEDAYIGHVPKTIMFSPLEPSKYGGETLVTDCRKVYQDLPQKLKNKLHNKYMINNLVMHDDIFLVNNTIPKNFDAIKAIGAAHGSKNTSRISENLTKFSFKIPAIIKHESTNEPIWFNLLHIAPIFSYNTYIDTWFAYKCKTGLLNNIKAITIIMKTFFQDLKFLIRNLFNSNTENKDFLCEVGDYYISDNTKISFGERVQINLAIWKNTSVLPLKKGDMIALDNLLTSHGRMPFKGRRVFLAAMGELTSPSSF